MGSEMVIGVDLGGTHLRTALVDLTGNILRRQKTATGIALGVATHHTKVDCRVHGADRSGKGLCR